MAFMLIDLYNHFIKLLFEEKNKLPTIIQSDIENNIEQPMVIVYQSVIDRSGEVDSSITGL